ncbi:MAG: DUF1460 domain-containing protein [Bacteroidales bacterium]|nr:DUF1460 domain-containing protein [Bacteroidales bacterium]
MKKTKLFTLLLPALMLYGPVADAQWSSNMQQDQRILSTFFAQAGAENGTTMGELIIKSALFFLNTPYVGHTLEVGGKEEQLIINLRELDCTTFMETCVALSRVQQMQTPFFDAYCKQLQRLRYRNGTVNGYISRLHYTSDWIADNSAKGVIEDITGKIGGEPIKMQLSFMSSRPDSYVHLKGQPERTARIRQIEELISKKGKYHYIPKEKIPSLQGEIKSGDLICFTTSIEGLDISHVGIAYWRGDELTFIHASSTARKVVIDPKSIYEYCKSISSNTGIMVLRCRDTT